MPAWLPAVASADLPDGVVLPFRLFDEPLALWRSRSGHVSACADRCPHRGMRLSQGFVRGETLRCIYHGWSYAGSGACRHIPAHPGLVPPDAIRVRTWRVAETGGLVWVASGDPQDRPPIYAGLVPLRSLTAKAAPASLQASAEVDGTTGLLGDRVEGPVARALLCAQAEGQTVIHVLVPETSTGAERIAASRWSEVLRRSAEARERGKAVA